MKTRGIIGIVSALCFILIFINLLAVIQPLTSKLSFNWAGYTGLLFLCAGVFISMIAKGIMIIERRCSWINWASLIGFALVIFMIYISAWTSGYELSKVKLPLSDNLLIILLIVLLILCWPFVDFIDIFWKSITSQASLENIEEEM